MKQLAAKEQLLKEAGYTYRPDREAYINRRTRKIFSVDFLEEHEPDEIASKIREATPDNEWTFIFNQQPTDSMKRELARLLNA